TKGNLWDIMGLTSLAILLSMIIAPLGTISEQYGTTATGIILVLAYIVLSVVIGVTTNTFLFFRYHQSDLEKRGEITKTATASSNYIAVIIAIIASIAYGFFEFQTAAQNIETNDNVDTQQLQESLEILQRS